MVDGLMAGHMKLQHGISVDERWSWLTSSMRGEPRTYRMSFLSKGGPQSFSVEGCPKQAATRTAMQVHFLHRNFRNTVVILEEGSPPHPWCPRCDILVPWRALNGRHIATAQCASGAERKRIRLVEEELREISERAFQDYGEPL